MMRLPALGLLLVMPFAGSTAFAQIDTRPINAQDLNSDRLLPPTPTPDPNIHWSQDARISAALSARLNTSGCMQRVTVNTEQGHVILMGTVNRTQDIVDAGNLARQTPGVATVVNNLTVQPGLPTSVPNMQAQTPCR